MHAADLVHAGRRFGGPRRLRSTRRPGRGRGRSTGPCARHVRHTAPVHASRGWFGSLYWLKRLIYRGGRPGLLARRLNGFWARQYGSARMARDRDVTLEVPGRSSGRTIVLPVVLADHAGAWFVVSMLGEQANWVRNVRAAQGHAVIRHGAAHEVELVEVPPGERAPILRRYVEVAPGARPHVPVPPRAPLTDFERIAADFPVFKVDGLGQAPQA